MLLKWYTIKSSELLNNVKLFLELSEQPTGVKAHKVSTTSLLLVDSELTLQFDTNLTICEALVILVVTTDIKFSRCAEFKNRSDKNSRRPHFNTVESRVELKPPENDE